MERFALRALACLALLALLDSRAPADTFTFRTEDGETETVEARLAGSGEGVHALELPDGQIRLVPQGAVTTRQPGEDPEPLSCEAVAESLTARFGEETFRVTVEEPYVIGLVLTAPLEKAEEVRARSFVRKVGRFMKNVERVFLDFARSAHFETSSPKYPLVVLVFETDTDFEKYADEATGGRGLSAGNIAGFYSGLTNWLAIRMSECHTFEVPLHEAIHQQVYNQHVFQRLAPIPAWFNEGIATGFEGTGERINVGPNRINSHYAEKALRGAQIDWAAVVADDRAFRGDVLAGDAYTHAWSLHWMLCTKYEDEYSDYVQTLAQKQTLEEVSAEQRTKEFEAAFGRPVGDLQAEFAQALGLGMKRQRITIKKDPPGLSETTSNLAEVELTAVSHLEFGGALEVRGRLRNISPIRAMSYHVTVETDSGTYADWHVPHLDILKTVTLKPQVARKVMPGAPGGPSRTFRVRVRSITPDSRDAQLWNNGQLPVPEYGQ